MIEIKPPYPYFGGKYTIRDDVWKRLGYTPNFVDPFFGGGSSLWFNPYFDWLKGEWTDNRRHLETVNDLDGMVSNFWRAISYDSAGVAEWADWPVVENDLHARHICLVNHEADLVQKLEGNPDYYDARIAGYWVWGMCAWIGSGFCSGNGPWQAIDGMLVNDNNGQGINRQLPHLGGGRGINRQLPHLGGGQGINRQRREWLEFYFARLQDRLREVRVCSGDWTRVLGPTPTEKNGLTGVFLDPPYSAPNRDDVYNHDSYTVQNAVISWAIDNGPNPKLRIALCGYDNFDMPDDWELMTWKANGGYEHQSDTPSGNRERECVWFSPHCLKIERQLELF